MHRRTFLTQSLAAASLPAALKAAAAPSRLPAGLTDPAEIRRRTAAARPLAGARIPENLPRILGATHYDGHYHLTQKPFLIEGAEQIRGLGFDVAKFWLREDDLPGYGYNSDWSAALKTGRLVDVLRHPYYVETLEMPFRTVMLEVFPLVGNKQTFFAEKNDFADEEEQFHEVASHLLKTYGARDMVFILQHWEGDWMLRREEGGTWGEVPADEIKRRCDAFIRWLAARQRGVERARAEAPAATRCKVYHAAEVNRVWDLEHGLPTLTTHVLPHVALDLVSWSAYDGLADETRTWHGIELIQKHMRPSPTFGNKAVYIGEIGKPERGLSRREIIDFWDRVMGVFLAMEIPWIVHWELYCNEPHDGSKQDRRPRQADDMRGFWLIRPDGSLSHAGDYLAALVQHAGGTLPTPLIDRLRSPTP
jgi:hypothetical protein